MENPIEEIQRKLEEKEQLSKIAPFLEYANTLVISLRTTKLGSKNSKLLLDIILDRLSGIFEDLDLEILGEKQLYNHDLEKEKFQIETYYLCRFISIPTQEE